MLLANPQSARLAQQIQGAPDTLVAQYVTNMAQRDVLLRRADSAKVAVTPEELAALHKDFAAVVAQTWAAMGIDPKMLQDSAKTKDARGRLAAARVEAFLDKIMAGEAQPVPIPSPLQIVLMNKFDAKVNAAGIDRAVERASKLRVTADSARAASQPKSAVPLPGAPSTAPVVSPSAVPVPKKP